jgi:hypothetical protein
MKRCAAVLLLFPLSCFAVDGVYEINQLCVDSGCFNGDSPGWPVTLSQSGSYRLTSNLDVLGYDGALDITAIQISAPNVSLDLNGFSIKGPNVGGAVGSGYGINSAAVSTSISNGHVTGMGGVGIHCGENCRIDKVSATSNGFTGIEMSGKGLLTNSASSNNFNIGVNTAGTVKNCVISGNSATGVLASSYSLVESSQIIGNTSDGVGCSGCSLVNNVIAENGCHGIAFSGTASYGGNHLYGHSCGDINIPMFQTATNNCTGAACPDPAP